MKNKNTKPITNNINHQHPLDQFPDEASCIDYIKKIRWPDKTICPFCGHDQVYHFDNMQAFKCKSCRKIFSVRIGTIFEGSKIPLQKWFWAIWLTNRERYITSVALEKELKVSPKTAWSISRALKNARITKSFNSPLSARTISKDIYT